jgi:uncharacterized protein (DUF433 family)
LAFCSSSAALKQSICVPDHADSCEEVAVSTVSYAHIERDARGEPIIVGTRIKVRLIALDEMAHGWTAEEIQQHHPDLTLGQVHSALAFYHDHKEEMDRDIAERHERVETLRAAQRALPGKRKLRERGLLP